MKIFFTILCMLLLVVTFTTNAKTIDDAIVEQMFLDNQLDSGQYEIEIISNRLKQKEFNNDDLFLKPLTLKEPLGLYTVLVTILHDGEEIETSQVRMRIRKFATVLLSNDRLKRHTELSTLNTSVERVEVTNLRSKPYLSVEETAGYWIKGSVQRSIPLTSSMLEKIPDIIAGRETTIIYSGSIFKITADGVALQTGTIGDFIKVKNKTSKKIIVARVIDSHHVAVDP